MGAQLGREDGPCGSNQALPAVCFLLDGHHVLSQLYLPAPLRTHAAASRPIVFACPQPNSIEFDMAIEWRQALGQLAAAKQELCMEQVRRQQGVAAKNR